MRFTDSAGAQWAIEINVGTLQQIKRELGLDLLDDVTQWPERLEHMVGILWICCEKQAGKEGIEPEEFATRLTGEHLAEGMEAFVEALAFFFKALNPNKAKVILAAWAKGKEVEARSGEILDQALGKLSTG